MSEKQIYQLSYNHAGSDPLFVIARIKAYFKGGAIELKENDNTK